MLIDPNDGQQAVSNTPDTSQPGVTPAGMPDTQTPAGLEAPPQLPAPSAPNVAPIATPPNAQPQPSVSNAPVHPMVQKAGILRQVAEALAGGPRYTTSVDSQTGAVTRTAVPLSGRDIGMAIALEALSGGMAGAAAKGPNATGLAMQAGLKQGQQIAQQRVQQQQQADEQAQNDYQNQTSALARKASIFEANQRAILSTAQAERYGVESLKDAVSINAPLLSSYQDADAVLESNVPQDALQAGVQSGKYSSTEMVAVPDGFVPSVDGRYEQTFSIVKNPSAKVLLTPQQAKTFADAGIPGWDAFKTSKVAQNFFIPGTFLANANQQLQAINLMKSDVSQVSDALANSNDKADQTIAKTIPNFDELLKADSTGPALRSALMKLQKFVSHSDITHGMDFYQSLQAMAAPSKPDPRNPKQFTPNPDASAAQVIAGAFGNGDPRKGWQVLSRYSELVTPEPIKNVDEAKSIVTDPASTPRQKARANSFLALDTAQKTAVARAGAEVRQEVRDAADANKNNTPMQPDALGFTPNVEAMGGVKEYNKRFNTFKKNTDDLARTEGSYQQFGSILNDLASGKDMTGAESVVGLFNAIGLSGTALQGKGFRISNNVINEHRDARGWQQALQAKLLNAKTGDIITPQQLRDYATIAQQARQSAYVNLANQLHSAGLSADAALPTGNGQKIDAPTARIFLTLTGNNPSKARQAASAKGWNF